MHLNFHFTTVQTLWTLTFAALLVLLVVLLGRDRTKRFPWFTASIVIVALNLLANRLLYGKLPQMTMSAIYIVMSDIAALVAFVVLVEVARRVFAGAGRFAWMVWTLVLLAIAGAVLAKWGPWPAWATLTANSTIGRLSALQLVAQKLVLFNDVVTVGLGLLVVLFGRRYGAGWRSHAQQIMIGLSTASIGQLAVEGIWQTIAKSAAPKSMEEYQHIVGLRDKLFNTNSVVYIVVLVWWIVCLWRDEPGAAVAEAGATAPVHEMLESAEPSEGVEE